MDDPEKGWSETKVFRIKMGSWRGCQGDFDPIIHASLILLCKDHNIGCLNFQGNIITGPLVLTICAWKTLISQKQA